MEGDKRKAAGRMEMFSVLIWLMATQVHTYGKTHPAVHLRFVYFPL